MRHLFAAVLLLCSATVAAQQDDDRRIRTVQTDEHPEPAQEAADGQQSAPQQDERLVLARQLVGISKAQAGEPAEQQLEILAQAYADTLSVAELQDVIAFQDSPSGRAFIAATRHASATLNAQ